MPSGFGMSVVRINKDELLAIVRKNRETHRDIFLKAVDGYRVKAIELLDQRLADAKAGRRVNLVFRLPTPVDQTREYDDVIRMLEMSVDNVVELTRTEFSNYVQDDWSWKKQFSATNKLYTPTADVDSPIVGDED